MNLSQIKQLEKNDDQKTYALGKNYYFSDEAKRNAKKINSLKKQYLEKNPTDYLVKGADIFNYLWYTIDSQLKMIKKFFV